MPRKKPESESAESVPAGEGELLEVQQPEELEGTDEELDEFEEIDGDADEVAQSIDQHFFPYTEETAQFSGLKVLFYGASGAGKTWMAGTFPRPLFLDLEGGMRPVRHMGAMRWPHPAISVTDISQVKEFWKLVRTALRERDTNGVDPGFDTIVIDGLNELQDLVMRHVIDTFPARRQYEDQPVQADYGKANRDLLAMVRLFLKFPCNVVFTCNEVYHEGDLDGKFGPKMVGRAAVPEIMRLVDMVGRVYTYREEEDGPLVHAVVFEDSPTQYGKDRIGLENPAIINDYAALAEQL